jgi:hypothetical protein
VDVKPELKKEFLELVDRLAELSRVRNAHNEKIQALRERERVLYARHTLAVCTARDANGKPTYSNEAMRQAALTIRWSEDAEAEKMRVELVELDRLQEELAVQHNALVDRKALAMLELGLIPPPGEEIPIP